MANGGADASQGEGWWQASDGKWYPPQTASPSIPPPPPPQTPRAPPVEDDGGDGSDKPPFWRRRWVLITGGILIVLIVITALTDTSGDDESDTATGDEPAAAEDEPDESGETSTTSSTSKPPACEAEGGSMAVDASCFDEAWPLTVESGILYCDADAVTFASSEDAVGYAVNGMASTRGAVRGPGSVDDRDGQRNAVHPPDPSAADS